MSNTTKNAQKSVASIMQSATPKYVKAVELYLFTTLTIAQIAEKLNTTASYVQGNIRDAKTAKKRNALLTYQFAKQIEAKQASAKQVELEVTNK